MTETTETGITEPTATETTTAGETPTLSGPVTGEGIVMISKSAGYGPILVNGEGMSLYVFLADTQNSGASTCYEDDGCSTDWPFYLYHEDSVPGDVNGQGLFSFDRFLLDDK